MSWAQHVETLQKQLETSNGLSFGLSDPLASALVPPIGANLGGSKSPESVPLSTLFNFQRTVYRVYSVLTSSPTDS